ncbi:cytolysin [Fomitiporia mediterranea MF3/22]|uniref:cytolysin n=1 Tax=Fomitiporia mediterranea (strain MF3/22) TaxID=694068 RepID=UPI0004408517|nr:cytolysin [Fomitiporia mediterranea MF3/22]EJC99843.1 cytolysin [Fomitiporia mediterranea MF3/22]
MSRPRTSWEDLSNLGWPIQQVYNRANAERGYTMQGLGDIFLNSGIALDYQWYCYNVLKGEPYVKGQAVNSISQETTVWSYDNLQNSQDFTTNWGETWTETNTATLSITNSAHISLSQSITIPGVGGSEFSISISTESTQSETRERSYQVSNTWDITIGPHEKVSIVRELTTTTGVAEYGQRYGVDGRIGSMYTISSKGDRYNDHYYWGMDVNWLLNNPSGEMTLNGIYRSTSYHHKIIREGPNGKRTVEPLPDPSVVTEIIGDNERKEIRYMVYGDE